MITIKTPKSKSPQSKVSKDRLYQTRFRLVNPMQCAPYNTATLHKGKGPTILCSFPQQKTVTVTALPALLFTEGQEIHKRVVLAPTQSRVKHLIKDSCGMQLKDAGKTSELLPFCQISSLDRHTARHLLKCH